MLLTHPWARRHELPKSQEETSLFSATQAAGLFLLPGIVTQRCAARIVAPERREATRHKLLPCVLQSAKDVG
jgi:UPF0716 family protein affecting phage T7 exclusion